jgi:hypothetical protein
MRKFEVQLARTMRETGSLTIEAKNHEEARQYVLAWDAAKIEAEMEVQSTFLMPDDEFADPVAIVTVTEI